ncbi:MAG TPA: response regulator transcription factor [Solirubrobacteraceae bacterium]|nr:response regulator transcription factor [Solirubrobacteraceae bacterium]
MLKADAYSKGGNERAAQGAATLIAPDPPGARIGELLRAHGLQTTSFEHVEEAIDEQRSEDPAIVVLWAKDDSRSPARMVGSLAQGFERVPLVLVCADVKRWGIRAALESGAAGVVLHDELDTTFEPCLRAVLAGQICVPRSHGRELDPPALSAREKQILGLVVMGYMNRQIATQLYLAESTVKSHLSSAFGKLGVRSRHEAVNLILNPDRGLGLGILGLGVEPVQPVGAGQ